MATVGQILAAPEAGWKRCKYSDLNFTYIDGTWLPDPEYDYMWSPPTSEKIKFNFTGNKLRILIGGYPNHSELAEVYIDGQKVTTFSEQTNERTQYVLVCDIQGLEDKEHSVRIEDKGTHVFSFHGIDISDNWELKPFEPIVPNAQGGILLRVTMIDSSEREYRLSIAEVDDFIKWYTRTLGTGISCYALNDIIDNSQEYLAFEKIISFKVMELK